MSLLYAVFTELQYIKNIHIVRDWNDYLAFLMCFSNVQQLQSVLLSF
jgi:hypothetical protein